MSGCGPEYRKFVGMSAHEGIVLQNYFQHPGAKDRFKIVLPAAT